MAERRLHQLSEQIRRFGPAGLRGLGATALIALGWGLGWVSHAVALADPQTSTSARVRADILARHPSPPSEVLLDDAAAKAMVGTLDMWSRYYTAGEVALATAAPADQGLGLSVRVESDALHVIRSSEPTVQVGDRITAVDGIVVTGHPSPESLLLGQARTASVLTVVRDGGVRVVPVQRDWRGPAPLETRVDGALCVVVVRRFPAGVTELWDGNTAGCAGVVVDLRGNPGGEMREAVRFLDRLLSGGNVLSSAVRGEFPKIWTLAHHGNEPTVPLAVWVDGATASAAEIVASGLQTGGATVLGSPPVGKRSIQTTLYYESGAALQLTIGRFDIPDLRIDKAATGDDLVWSRLTHSYLRLSSP